MLKYWQYWALMGIGAGLSSVDVTTGIWALFPSTEVVYAKRHLLEDHPIWRDVPMPNYVVVDLVGNGKLPLNLRGRLRMTIDFKFIYFLPF